MTPLVLACIVGTGMEQYFRRAYKLHDGDLTIFISSPLCGTFIVLTAFVVVLPVIRNKIRLSRAKKEAHSQNTSK
ncbi:MAG: hypothetical protein IKH45_08090 [Neisseriaceae bacterium]|nr:hypothetical protein [Neisseriaceae bacterium]